MQVNGTSATGCWHCAGGRRPGEPCKASWAWWITAGWTQQLQARRMGGSGDEQRQYRYHQIVEFINIAVLICPAERFVIRAAGLVLKETFGTMEIMELVVICNGWACRFFIVENDFLCNIIIVSNMYNLSALVRMSSKRQTAGFSKLLLHFRRYKYFIFVEKCRKLLGYEEVFTMGAMWWYLLEICRNRSWKRNDK